MSFLRAMLWWIACGIAALLCGFLLAGCASIEKVTPPETLAACAAADVVTTIYGVKAGVMQETNPTFAKAVNAGKFGKFILTTAAIVALAWWLYEEYREYEAARATVALSAVIYCGAAANNLGLIF